MPKQKYDNQAMAGVEKQNRINRAKAKVTDLVKRGVRINRKTGSDYYLKQLSEHGNMGAKYDVRKERQRRATKKAGGK